MSNLRKKVMVVGGGVAALEVCLGLHWGKSTPIEITLVTRDRDFIYRPLAVLEPFGRGASPSFPIAEVVEGCVGEVVHDEVTAIDAAVGSATTASGREIEFDAAVIATGAVAQSELEGAMVVGAPGSNEQLTRLIGQIDAGLVERVVFCAPRGASWALPLYELAMFTSDHARMRLREVDIQLITPEWKPLIQFGSAASVRVTKPLAQNAVKLRAGVLATDFRDGVLNLSDGSVIETKYVVALPKLKGLPIEGLPHDPNGFLHVDGYGRVPGMANIFAAGDITDFPIKQGGIASQQADAVVGAVTEFLGGGTAIHGFEPDLHGLLLSPQGWDSIQAPIHADDNPDGTLRKRTFVQVTEKIFSKHLTGRLTQLYSSRAPVS